MTLKIHSGDTLTSLAKKYHTTVGDLAKANSLSDPNKLRAGSNLIVPDKFQTPGPIPTPSKNDGFDKSPTSTRAEKTSNVKGAADTSTVKGCAQYLLNSKNVSFWKGLSTGSDRKNMERLARGEKAFVPSTGKYVTPNLRMMQSLVAMAQKGKVQINAMTGGKHENNSKHYSGNAVDLAITTGDTKMLVDTAKQYGGRRNKETSHIHLKY